MVRTQITLDAETQRQARQHARQLVTGDLGSGPTRVEPKLVFDLGRSDGSDVARNKAAMVAEAFGSAQTEYEFTVETAEKFWDGLRNGVAAVDRLAPPISKPPGKSGCPIATRIFRSWTGPASP